ncbi:hypothetical protein HID58_029601 [Brassica napus]|uniref:Uncharacterized protein n=1 Tax=Brassica napus TaxID=3708 RepID=A0ABQ8CDK1_BRANA|nr:hypothetical protein HID58_029601 [Brassica napus]
MVCRLVPFNLRTQKERILRDDENQDYFMNRIGVIHGDQDVRASTVDGIGALSSQVEMIDTNSLPSFPKRKRNRDNNDVF